MDGVGGIREIDKNHGGVHVDREAEAMTLIVKQ